MDKRKSNNSVLQHSSKIYSVEIDGEIYEVIVSDDESVPVSVSIGKRSLKFRVKSNGQPESLSVSHGENQLQVMIEKSENNLSVHLGCRHMEAAVRTERDLLLARHHSLTPDKTTYRHIESPLPGLITKVQAKTGSKLKKGENIVIIEAMKMENEIRAPHDCKIKKINVKKGQSIDKGHIIALFE